MSLIITKYLHFKALGKVLLFELCRSAETVAIKGKKSKVSIFLDVWLISQVYEFLILKVIIKLNVQNICIYACANLTGLFNKFCVILNRNSLFLKTLRLSFRMYQVMS